MPTRLILFTALLVATTACGNAPVEPAGDPVPQQHVSLDASVTLAPGQTAVVDGTPLRIGFVEVTEDSRCPTTVTCVWEGRARVSLRVDDGQGEEAVTLEARPGVTHGLGHGGYLLEIEGLTPYPETTDAIAQKDYRLTLRVVPPA